MSDTHHVIREHSPHPASRHRLDTLQSVREKTRKCVIRSLRGTRLGWWCVSVGVATVGVSCRPGETSTTPGAASREGHDRSIRVDDKISSLLGALQSTEVEVVSTSEVGGDVLVVTYMVDRTDAWEGGLRERGELEAVMGKLEHAESACEAHARGDTADVEVVKGLEVFWEPINDLDDRSCHHRALEALAPDGVADQCLALEVARVRGSTVEPCGRALASAMSPCSASTPKTWRGSDGSRWSSGKRGRLTVSARPRRSGGQVPRRPTMKEMERSATSNGQSMKSRGTPRGGAGLGASQLTLRRRHGRKNSR